ncbi:unnamed protein product [Dovyalis caffra]|uniref:GDSL esterase/lipase n=1 Tax=Dovyalis caffra TaxID=77055 RepID=A0AAV1SSS0_9ROSI|nr:unnamed protein product [Dovyalis caffra]
MASRMSNSCSLSLIMFLVLVCLAKPVVPAIFIFGDSTTDIGTNNYLPVHQARADFPFNGIDFHGARFSNGYNIADTIARLFGYQRSPPVFLSLLYDRGSESQRYIFWGANFASGGAGLLDTTGLQFINRTSSPLSLEPPNQCISSFDKAEGAATMPPNQRISSFDKAEGAATMVKYSKEPGNSTKCKCANIFQFGFFVLAYDWWTSYSIQLATQRDLTSEFI